MIKLIPDIPEMARHWRNDPKIYRWCRQYRKISEPEHERWLRKINIDTTICMFGIQTEDALEVRRNIGVCGFTSIDMINRSAEFSLYIAPDYQKLGNGSRALLALLSTGFGEWGFNRIWGEVYADNPAMKMFEYCGFKKEGKRKQAYFREGKFIDATMVAVLAGDFKK